ncbi:hypothetical protein AB0C52_12810 [Streptomyces sp. NPDC048717]|uniref:hypothetical protein n=1 Tax=Streptomyces sp. NPDC048717 TaxID=3154928 RepID=UPI00342E4CC9
MNTDLATALASWEQQWGDVQEAAAVALKTAFPALADVPRFVGCEHLRLEYADGDHSGVVCVDEGRATIQFSHLPNSVIAGAVDEVQFPYLDCAEGLLAEASPGSYSYDCEVTSALFEFTLGALGHGEVDIWSATIPDAVEVLDAFRRALEEHEAGAPELQAGPPDHVQGARPSVEESAT